MSELQLRANQLAIDLYRAEAAVDCKTPEDCPDLFERIRDLRAQWDWMNDNNPVHSFVAAYRLATREIGVDNDWYNNQDCAPEEDPQQQLDFEEK